MAQKKKPTSTVHASPGAAAAHFVQEAKAALSAGQAAGGDASAPVVDVDAWKERIEADKAATVERLRLVVEDCFGRPPEHVIRPLHRAVEAFNWLGALFECIEEANADSDRFQSSARIQALASLGAYIAGDYQVSIIGEPADEMQASIEAAQAGGAA